MKNTLLCTSLLYLQYVFADNADNIAKLDNFYTCPDFSQINENRWCSNCTFIDERNCIQSDEHTSTFYTYKSYECPNSCILPVSWKVFHRSFLSSKVWPFGNLPRYDNKLRNCYEYGNDKLNPTCSNCTTIKDDYCLYNINGIVCQTREYKCPEYDRGCTIFYNCTAPINNNLPNFTPKIGLDDNILEQTNGCNSEDIQPIKENPGCINCLYTHSHVCIINTKYSDTTYYYYVFDCPLNGGQKCALPQESITYYAKKIKGVTICPEISEDPICRNCTRLDQKPFVCSEMHYSGDFKTSSMYKLYSYTCPESDVKCFSDNGEEPVTPWSDDGGFGSLPEDLTQFAEPPVLASLIN